MSEYGPLNRASTWFKALKTGCHIEKRQLESYAALRIAAGLASPSHNKRATLPARARQARDREGRVVRRGKKLNVPFPLSARILRWNGNGHLARSRSDDEPDRSGDPLRPARAESVLPDTPPRRLSA